MMNREPISCRAVNALTARLESFAARKARVFKRAIFNLAAHIDNNNYNYVIYLERSLTYNNIQVIHQDAFSGLYSLQTL